ncbi:DUF4197 domain-containing protein [Novosphingobium sp. M1R2S20]|uniref:DUF4197 domain-containing protein n=1 Tax=Novosphingobium rhizovicinum TaxID=3228928 RepID=A0ABV3RFX7_9SPHN
MLVDRYAVNLRAPLGRRGVLGGGLGLAGLLVLPACTTTSGLGEYFYVDAVRRLLEASTRNAFARLTAPEGFWDSAVARIELPVLFGKRGSVMEGILRSPAFRERLQHRLNIIAEDGARAAAPVVADTVRTIGIENAYALITGEPSAATTFLRAQMGAALVNAMIPELQDIMRITSDPLVNQALSLLAGVDVAQAAHALALEADNAIWYEIGAEEAAIRRDPGKSGDPVLKRVFGG